MKNQQSLAAAICLALVLTIGVSLGWGFVVGWVTTFVEHSNTETWTYEVLHFREDGLPVIQWREGVKFEYRSVDGKPYSGPQQFSQLSPAVLPGTDEFSSQVDWTNRLMGFRDDARSPTYWYFVVDQQIPRGGWFEGFDGQTKHRLGYITINGYQREKPRQDQRFPLPDRMPSLAELLPDTTYRYAYPYYEAENAAVVRIVHLASQDSIYQIDLKSREVRKFADVPGLMAMAFTTSAVSEVRDLETVQKQRQLTWTTPKNWLVCRTPKEVVMIDLDDQQRIVFPIPTDLRGKQFYVYGGREPTTITLHETRFQQDGTDAHRVIWLHSDGHVERELSLTLRRTLPYQSDIVRIGMVGILCPGTIPVAFDIAYLEPAFLVQLGFEASHWSAAMRCIRNGWPVLAGMSLLSLGMAVIAYRRQRRYDQPHATAWFIFVFLLGVAGFVGYLLHRTWPTREPCPSCREPAPRDREICSECGELFPPPARKGIEVLA